MRVQLIDPSADVLPYDHALAAALARRGASVELVTSRFVHGPAPAPNGYAVTRPFYRLATGPAADHPRVRRALKLAEHVPDTLRLRRHAAAADLQHWQWLWLEAVTTRLLPRGRPQVLTMHNVIRRAGSGRRLAERMDAVIVHTRHGAELLGGGPRVHVIPHGAFEHLTQQADERPLPPELAAVEGPVVLCFGVVRPYKGVDVLVDAFRSIEAAELWVVGRPLGVDLESLAAPPNVRFVPRYVSDAELPAYFRRADLLVLPHRSVDVSGVLFAGLAFGKAMVLSDVGGFREVVEDHGAGRLVAPGDPRALAAAIGELLDDPAERQRLGERARAAAAGPYSWDSVAQRTLGVYEEVLAA
jgi:glycosyltransferase involved in cell wall biosynthesis